MSLAGRNAGDDSPSGDAVNQNIFEKLPVP